MDTLRWSLAWGPVALYFIVLGSLHLRRRAFVLAGWRDTAALGVACAGLALVGPLDLFMPFTALQRFGPFVWGLLIGLYSLAVMLVALGQRPRLVVYNAARSDEAAAVDRVAHALDPAAARAGGAWALPGLQLEVRLEAFRLLRTAAVMAEGDDVNLPSWLRFQHALWPELMALQSAPFGRGASLVAIGLAMLLSIAWQLQADPQALAQSWVDLWRL